MNEAITTLLLNYVAIDLMLYLIYDPWKDPNGTGQPATRPAGGGCRLPFVGHLPGARRHRHCRWSSPLRSGSCAPRPLGLPPAGGRRQPRSRPARRLPVQALLLSAMLGRRRARPASPAWSSFAGAEFKLRQGMTADFGYIAFLASWLARHHPLKVVVAAVAARGHRDRAATACRSTPGCPAATRQRPDGAWCCWR